MHEMKYCLMAFHFDLYVDELIVDELIVDELTVDTLILYFHLSPFNYQY